MRYFFTMIGVMVVASNAAFANLTPQEVFLNPPSGARLFGLEFSAVSADGRVKKKLVLAEGFNHSPECNKAVSAQSCIFAKDELGEGDVRFTVTPMNCFGTRGKPLFGEYKA